MYPENSSFDSPSSAGGIIEKIKSYRLVILVLLGSLIIGGLIYLIMPSKSNNSGNEIVQENGDGGVNQTSPSPTQKPTATPALPTSTPTPYLIPTGTPIPTVTITVPTPTPTLPQLPPATPTDLIPSPTPTAVAACNPNIQPPQNLTPNNDVYDGTSTTNAGSIALNWEYTPGANKFFLDIIDVTDNKNINLNVQNPITTNSYTFISDPYHEYRWSVQAGDRCGNYSVMSFSAYIRVRPTLVY